MPGSPPSAPNVVALRAKSHKAINHFEPDPDAIKPDPPAHLSEEEAAKWVDVCDKLFVLGCLTTIDTDDVEKYCAAWVRYQLAGRTMRLEGYVVANRHGDWVLHPINKMLQEASTELQRFSDRFGFNPAYRTKIKALPPGGAVKSRRKTKGRRK